ncbi:MAG: peptidylprolyl isomerase [Gemmatimonadaceae bacterium]
MATACAAAPRGSATLSEANIREYAMLLRMADSRMLDTAVVDRGLASSSSAVRAEAARAIGQIGRAAAAPRVAVLRPLLRGTSASVAAQAAYSLGLLRDSASTADLVEALTWFAPVSREAAWALGQLGNAVRTAIVDALARGHEDPATRVQLLLAAAKLSPVPAQSVIEYFDDEHPSVVWAAAYAISRTRTVTGLSALWALGDSLVANRPVRPGSDTLAASFDASRGAFIDPESAPYRIRAEIARVLTRSAAGDSLASRAIPSLAQYARDPHPHVRINAIRSLGSYGARARAHLVSGARDPDANVRIAAAQSLAAVRDSADVPWQELWAVDTGFTFRRSLLEASLRFGVELPAVASWSGDTEWRRRAAVAAAAGGAPTGEQSLRIAEPLLSDSDARVRGAALSGIASDTGRITPRVRELLNLAAADPDRMVSERARATLSRRAEDESESAAPVRDVNWYVDVVRTIVAPALDGRPVRATFTTERGPIVVEFFGVEAPLTVKNFLDLARGGTFRGTRFHRVVPNFVVQDGDPRGDGTGGPGYSIRDELNPHRYDRGVLGMALSGPDTGGSQWFSTHSPQPHLDGGYTVFGRVVSGFGVLDRIVQGDLLLDVR